MTPDELEWARAFVAKARWQFASSVPQTPHEYSLDRWSEVGEFGEFSRLIRTYGHKERWQDRHTYTYLDIGDGLRYWLSPAVYGRGWIVNRAKPDDSQQRLEGVE
jgi:hypothetical protein